jgi:16S rRNA (cytidine1402-2'-O)-methyltransferase
MLLGTLYLIPVPLADQVAAASFTPFASQMINQLDEYIVENEKTARRFLKEAGLKIPQSQLILHDFGKHSRDKIPSKTFLAAALNGKDLGLMSEAGCPAIADPGAEVVAEAHRLGIKVVPLVGPSSMILALMASGLNGQSFAFQGYLPIDKATRTKRIKELERESALRQQTQLFIETPFRNESLLEELLRSLSPKTKLCVAVDLTAPTEQIVSLSVQQWKQEISKNSNFLPLHKRPAIFLFLG